MNLMVKDTINLKKIKYNTLDNGQMGSKMVKENKYILIIASMKANLKIISCKVKASLRANLKDTKAHGKMA